MIYYRTLSIIHTGKFDFYEMIDANRILGPIFFFSYVSVVVWVLLNMFLSIINASFSQIRNETEAIDGELEIVEFMIERFKRWTGFSEPRIKKTDTDKHGYIEGRVKNAYQKFWFSFFSIRF